MPRFQPPQVVPTKEDLKGLAGAVIYGGTISAISTWIQEQHEDWLVQVTGVDPTPQLNGYNTWIDGPSKARSELEKRILELPECNALRVAVYTLLRDLKQEKS